MENERWIEWIEPFGPTDEPVYLRISESTAIKTQRVFAAAKPHIEYKTDSDALDDFMVCHWAQFVEGPKNGR